MLESCSRVLWESLVCGFGDSSVSAVILATRCVKASGSGTVKDRKYYSYKSAGVSGSVVLQISGDMFTYSCSYSVVLISGIRHILDIDSY